LGDLLRFSPAVSDFGTQDGPDDDPQLAGDGFLATDAVSQALEWFEPVAAEPSDTLKWGLAGFECCPHRSELGLTSRAFSGE